jgi:phage-related protein
LKPIVFLGDTLDRLRLFPEEARREAGYQLERVQRGLDPDDWKPMKTVGEGVREIRVRDSSGAYRVIYIATFRNAVYALHAFSKKTRQTSKLDLALAASRLKELKRRMKNA